MIPTPVDPTLSNQGEAADAYATGQAVAGVFSGAKVNNKSFVNKAVSIDATDIPVSDASGAQTVAAALESVADRDASDIIYDATNVVTVKGAIDGINDGLDEDFSAAEIADIIEEVYGGDD